MSYLACAMEKKKELGFRDSVLVTNVFLMILFGALLILKENFATSIILLSLSITCFIIVIIIILTKQFIKPTLSFSETETLIDDDSNRSNDTETKRLHVQDYMSEKQTFRSFSLLQQLAIIFAYFPIIYLLSVFKVFGGDTTLILYILGSVMGKLVFSSIIINYHEIMQDEYFMLEVEEIAML
jgi:hypothetical protein